MGTSDMSSGYVRPVSREDVLHVQNLIERCLKLYMNRKEVVEMLLAQEKIQPGFTKLGIWKKLEEENQEFFKAYYSRLLLKEQISEFNRLLKEYAELTKLQSTAVAPLPNSYDPDIVPLFQDPIFLPHEQGRETVKPENMRHVVDSSLHDLFSNDGSSLNTSMQALVEMSAHGNQIDSPPCMLPSQSSGMGLIQGINGGIIESEPGYSGRPPYICGPYAIVQEACPTIGDRTAVTSFPTVNSNSLSMNGALLDPDMSSVGISE